MNKATEWKQLVLPHILKLQAYSSARDEFSGQAKVFLDANENPFEDNQHHWNRYPDPLQKDIKEKLSDIKNVPIDQIFLGNGSDEAIDLLFRIFCEQGKSNVITCPPTYGMYKVSASIHNVQNIEVPLTNSFQLDVDAILKKQNEQSKLLFICSPNNPTGNSLASGDISTLLEKFRGIVVLDEAYIDFAAQESWSQHLLNHPKLVVLQTLSKAWGLASARLGMAFAHPDLVTLLNKVKPPYNISGPSQKVVTEALQKQEECRRNIQKILDERDSLTSNLADIAGVQQVYSTDSNFILIKIAKAKTIYQKLLEKGVVVRDRSNVLLCDDCLRITVGTKKENEILLASLHEVSN